MQNKLRLGLMIGLSFVSLASLACPKGTTLIGGTGPYHKGGTCVVADKQQPPATPAPTPKNTADSDKSAKADKPAKLPQDSNKQDSTEKAPKSKTPNTDSSKIGTVSNPLK